jgi:hypothetical protein
MTRKEAADVLISMQSYVVNEQGKDALVVAIAELSREYTSTPPTVVGEYWWRGQEGLVASVKRVLVGDMGQMKTDRGTNVRILGGEWCGPLTPPE